MTKRHSTTSRPHKSNSCHTRQLKVRKGFHDYQSNQHIDQRTEIGQIELKGHWLIEAGFTIEQPVMVRVMDQCLVLTVEPLPVEQLEGFSQMNPKEKQVLRSIVEEFLALHS